MRRRSEEHAEQAAVIRWSVLASTSLPELKMLLAIPNGGHRSVITGARLKAEGVRPGVPDLFLPIARGADHGLWIEMKAAKGRLSEIQAHWHARLREQGYRVDVCRSWFEARDVLVDYLRPGLPRPRAALPVGDVPF